MSSLAIRLDSLVLFVLLSELAVICHGTESQAFDRLAKVSDAPARFNPDDARFSIEERRFTWTWHGTPSERTANRMVVLDRNRMIGFWDGSSLTLLASNPTDDVSNAISPERWSAFLPFGTTLWFGGPPWEQPETGIRPRTMSSGKTLDLEWNASDEKDPQATRRVLHRTTIRLDAVFGYAIEYTMQWEATSNVVARISNDPKKKGFVPFLYVMSNGVLDPWSEYWPRNFAWQFYELDAVDIQAKEHPFGLIRMNLASWGWNDVPKGSVKPGGLTGFLGRDGNWGIVHTMPEDGVNHILTPDPEFSDYTVRTPLPEKADPDGKFRKTIRIRIAQLPPEIGKRVLGSGFHPVQHQRFFQVRLAGEDFEDQPLPVVQPTNAVRYGWAGMPCRVTSDDARSGKSSLEVKGTSSIKGTPGHGNRSWLRMYPWARYRMECWIKVVGKDTEAFVANHFAGLTTTNALAVGRYRTPSVREGDWEKVSIEFDPGPCGQAVILGFVCLGPGKAYFDDFSLQAVTPPSYAGGDEWMVEPGRFTVRIGSSSRDIRLIGGFEYQN